MGGFFREHNATGLEPFRSGARTEPFRNGVSNEPFRHGVGNEPFRHGTGNEPFRHGTGNEPFRDGARTEPFRSGTGNEPFGDHGQISALLAEALNTSTAAAVLRSDPPPVPRAVPALSALGQREPVVRAVLAQAEMLSVLRFARGQLWLMPAIDAEGVPLDAAVSLLKLVKPGEERLALELSATIQRKDERPDRVAEILVQRTDFWPFWTAVTGLSALRTPRTVELLNIAAQLSATIGQSFKQHLNLARPVELSGQVQPMIDTPGHASFPSGHATSAWLMARVMQQLLDLDDKDVLWVQLSRLASRIADNRVVAGVHYPVDSEAGRVLGNLLAACFVARCTAGSLLRGQVFDASGAEDMINGGPGTVVVEAGVALAELWRAARIELGRPAQPSADADRSTSASQGAEEK